MINVTETFLPPMEEYVAYLERVWESKWLTNRGQLVQELEAKLIDHLEVDNLLLVSNGTIALQIAIKALGLTGEIITTPFSYVATVSSIVWENCRPIFVDIDPVHLTIDETRIEEAITEKTSAILATHVYGNPCNVEVIQEIANRHKLKVIYDAAHCFGVKYKGSSILNWGDISTLSFHATKLFHTGEGGGIICRDPGLLHSIFYHHNFGHKTVEEFAGLGVNGKISELNAAMGLSVLPHIAEIVEKRRQACDIYGDLLGSELLQRPRWRTGATKNYSYYPVIFSCEEDLLRTQKRLNEDGVFPRRYFYPSLDRLPYIEGQQRVPVAQDIASRVICLPLYAGISNDIVGKITALIRSALG